jgi:hypothetical protein
MEAGMNRDWHSRGGHTRLAAGTHLTVLLDAGQAVKVPYCDIDHMIGYVLSAIRENAGQNM